MARFQIEVGNRFIQDGTELLVVEVQDDNNILFEKVRSGKRLLLNRNQVERDYFAGKLLLLQTHRKQEIFTAMPFDLMTIEQRELVKRRERYVLALEKEAVVVSVRSCIDEAISMVARDYGDQNPPSRATLSRWYSRWMKSGKSLSALAPRVKYRGRKPGEISREVRDFIREIIEERYLIREQPTLCKVIDTFILPALEKENASRTRADRMKIPSRASIYRILNELDPYEVILKREGKVAADRRFRTVGAGVKVDAPLDCVLVDHTILDIEVIAPVEGFVARPTLTVAMDLYSRMPWGIYVGFAAPGYESVMLCIRNGIMEKSGFLSNIPSITNDWPCHGLPRTMVVDNGMEFHSEHMRDMCRQLGISIVYHPVRAPHYKAAVERFFNTVNEGLLSGIKGRTFSNIVKKGDYDAIKNAVIPFKVFHEAFYTWIVDVYAQKFHQGIEDFPVKRWSAGVARFPVDLPQNIDDIHILLAEVDTRTLSQSGIQINNARYNSKELGDLYRRKGVARRVFLKVDPLNLGWIHVFDEEKDRYLTVPCLNQDYHGLNKWQYAILRKEIVARKKAGEVGSNIGEALQKIHCLLDLPNLGSRKSNKRAARHAECRENQKDKSVDLPDVTFIPESDKGELNRLLNSAKRKKWGKA